MAAAGTEKRPRATKVEMQKRAAEANGKAGDGVTDGLTEDIFDGGATAPVTEGKAPKETQAEKKARLAREEMAEIERLDKEEAEKEAARAKEAAKIAAGLPVLFGEVNQQLDKVEHLRNSVALMDDQTLIDLVKYAGTLGNASWRTQIAANAELASRVAVKCKKAGRNVKEGLQEVAVVLGINWRTMYNDAALQNSFFSPQAGKEDDEEEKETLRQLSDACEILQDKSYATLSLGAKSNRRNAYLMMAAERLANPYFGIKDAQDLVARLNGKGAPALVQAEETPAEGEASDTVPAALVKGSDVLSLASALSNAEQNALETEGEWYVWRDSKGEWGSFNVPNPNQDAATITIHADMVNNRGFVLKPGEEWLAEEGEENEPDPSQFDWPEEGAVPTDLDITHNRMINGLTTGDDDAGESSDSTTDD